MPETHQYWPKLPPSVTLFEDFSNDLVSSIWTGTALSSGTAAVLDTVPDGVIRLSGAATTDNSGYQIQRSNENIAFEAGRRYTFLARVRFGNTGSTGDTALQGDLVCGMCVTDTTIHDGSALAFTDGVFFYKADGAATITGYSRRDSANTTVGSYTVADGVWYDLAIVVTTSKSSAAVATIDFLVNGENIGTATTTTLAYEAEEYHTETVAFVSGDNSGTRYVDVDAIMVHMPRTTG